MDDGIVAFSNQLKVIKLVPSFFSTEDATLMGAEVSMMEVETTLKSFKKDKSPGLSGWLVEFFLFFF